MKLSKRLSFLFLFVIATSCQSNQNCNDEIICETVHRYGVPLQPEEWSSRGGSGQVVSMRKDGVRVSRSYDSGILHGECSYTFPHRDVIQKKEVYHQGDLKQENYHYVNGIPHKQINHFPEGHQSIVSWYESGAPLSKEETQGDYLKRGEYYTHDQQIESQVLEGNGLRTCRDGQGELISVDNIQNGQIVFRTTYHPNGSPAQIASYANGMIHGERRTYLPGGEPATIETWKNNVQEGTTTIFEQGEKRADVPYVKGVPHGIERRYRGDGQVLAQEVTWSKGQKHGPCRTYLGDVSQIDWYFQNKQVPNKATFDMLSSQ